MTKCNTCNDTGIYAYTHDADGNDIFKSCECQDDECTHEIVEFHRCAGCGESVIPPDDYNEQHRILAIDSDNEALIKSWKSGNPGKCIMCKKNNRISPQEGGCCC